MSWSRLTALLGFVLLLSGCGFEPMYRQPDAGSSVARQLSAVQVTSRLDRPHQLVRNELLGRMHRGEPVAPRYRLEFTVVESRGAVLVTRSEDVSRFNLSLVVAYSLLDTANKTVASGSVSTLASFNALRAEYFNVAAENEARERAARDAAAQLVTRLALVFERGQAQ
jgi:LPS-assembly lipoprotein